MKKSTLTCVCAVLFWMSNFFHPGYSVFNQEQSDDCPKPAYGHSSGSLSSQSNLSELDFSACIFPVDFLELPQLSTSYAVLKRSGMKTRSPLPSLRGNAFSKWTDLNLTSPQLDLLDYTDLKPTIVKYPDPRSNFSGQSASKPSAAFVKKTRSRNRHFRVRKLQKKYVLPVNWTSPMSGIVSSDDCSILDGPRCYKYASFEVVVPKNHVVMVSFPKFVMKWSFLSAFDGFVQLMALQANFTWTTIWKINNQRPMPAEVYHKTIQIHLYVPNNDKLLIGFTMSFSILPAHKTPRKVREGVFDCAVDYFQDFKHHLDCNLKKECERREDEGGHCPFSSPACDGEVSVGGKCYTHIHRQRPVQWQAARDDCRRRGGDLATVKSDDEWNAFFTVLIIKNIADGVYIGLQSSNFSHPQIYHGMYIWVDGVVNYAVISKTLNENLFFDRICFAYNGFSRLRVVFYVSCEKAIYRDYVCQIVAENITSDYSVIFPMVPVLKDPPQNATRNNNIRFTPMFTSSLAHNFSSSFLALWKNKPFLVTCPYGHVTHDFLACDPRSHCRETEYVPQCRVLSNGRSMLLSTDVIRMFVCDDMKRSLPYSLVCDFRKDCLDNSDETFCIHSTQCPEAHCNSGQCVTLDKACDGIIDCIDGSDEVCSLLLFRKTTRKMFPPPANIFFTAQGVLTFELKIPAYKDVCLNTHFLCPEGYCLPIYCRCNGVGDCWGKEDEAGCEMFQCPAFYRCLSSQVCVHADHLCDGSPHCPKQDDEWLCNATCPQGCLCEGHSFICSKSFPSGSFLHVRYLDATRSRVKYGDVAGMSYLVWLSLAWCELSEITPIKLPNLQTLSLTNNHLDFVDMGSFLILKNLKTLDLSSNPLVHLFSLSASQTHTSLAEVVLSDVAMRSFNCAVLSNFPTVRKLNLSHTPTLTDVSAEGFTPTPRLETLDLRGSNLQNYPANVFLNLTVLQEIHADNYKLCCTRLLPEKFDEKNCHARKDEISSCDDLLRSNNYRAFLWMFSILSIVGNMGCLVTRQFLVKSKSITSFNMFVTNLSIADLLMGMYLALVGAADHVYRGKYFWYEKTWKPSVACHIAGFLSLLSSEMSAFIICLITLDRFLVLRSPFSDIRFKRRTTIAACSLSWTLGIMLAVIPLLPIVSEWNFYSHTGICIPLPITRSTFKGRNYAFGIMIIFNLVLFLLIAVGQAMIYWTIRTASMAQSSTRKTKDLTIARRLLSIVLTDFMCWFPIGILGVMATGETPIPGEVNVGMAIFVLPLNAALNPFLYTFNALTERLKLWQEERLLRQLEARIQDLYDH